MALIFKFSIHTFLKPECNRNFLYYFFLTIITINQLPSQNYIPYYNLRNQALLAYHNSDYVKADSLLDQAFILEKGFAKDYHLMALVKAELGDAKESIKYIKLSFNGMSFNTHTNVQLDSSIFLKVLSKSEFDALMDTLRTVWNVRKLHFESDLHKNTMERVEEFIKRDQKYRSLHPADKREEVSDSLIMMNDQALQLDFIKYIEENGWPEYSSELLTTILLHSTKENFAAFDQLIFKQVKKGKLDPYWYASMIDRMEVFHGSGECKFKIWIKEDCDNTIIIENRREIGLSPYFTGPYRNHRKTITNVHHLNFQN